HALRDRDRERVPDHERADEQRDAREREQRVAQERDQAASGLLVLLRLLRAASDLLGRAQQRLDLREQRGLLHPGLRLDANAVELATLVEQLLGGGLVEDREGRAADAHVRKLGDAADLQGPDTPARP